MTKQVVTANDLSTGLVVYLAADRGWTERIEESRIATTDAESQNLLAEADSVAIRWSVVDPYLIEVTDEDGAVLPVRYRERIRALGPSIRTDLGRQAQEGL